MARSRRALRRKGNVTDIAEARKKREERQLAKEKALANARIGTLDEITRHADAMKVASAIDAAGNAALAGNYTITTQASAASGGGSESKPGTSGIATRGATASASTTPAVAKIAGSIAPEQSANESASKKASKKKKHGNRTYDEEKVEAIKKAIADGTYQINPTRIADKFIEREAPA